jgi:hypothetical protein
MKEVLGALCRSGIPFLVIGGHGLTVHNVQRDTVDFDCMVATDRAEKMLNWLKSCGFDEIARNPTFTRFRHGSLVYPIVDVMEVDAGTWEKLSANSKSGTLFGYPIRVPSLPHYIALKLHAMKQNPDRENKDSDDIFALIEANPASADATELQSLCERYAPPGFWDKLKKKL